MVPVVLTSVDEVGQLIVTQLTHGVGVVDFQVVVLRADDEASA